MAADPPRILCFDEDDYDQMREERPIYLQAPAFDRVVPEVFGVQYQGFVRTLWKLLWRNTRLNQADLVITASYHMAFMIALKQILTRSRARHVSVSMNQSRRAIMARNPVLRWAINKVMARVGLIIVHSTHEAEIFADLHDIPMERFAFAHWGYDVPEVGTMFDDYAKPYVCMIGRNNRDHATFLAALRGSDLRGVLIVPGYADLSALDIPENVEVFRDLGNPDCLSCQKNALASLILVNDSDRGAGHITAVSALHLGTAQVVSDALPLREYLHDGVTALVVPVGDAGAVRAALETLRDDPQTRERLIATGRDFAGKWLSAEATARRQGALIAAALEGRDHDFIDPAWARGDLRAPSSG